MLTRGYRYTRSGTTHSVTTPIGTFTADSRDKVFAMAQQAIERRESEQKARAAR